MPADDPEDQDGQDNNGTSNQKEDNDSSSSSSDDNDSTEAAHAAAIGHSPQPQPIRPAAVGATAIAGATAPEASPDAAGENGTKAPIKADAEAPPASPAGDSNAALPKPEDEDTPTPMDVSEDASPTKEQDQAAAPSKESPDAMDTATENAATKKVTRYYCPLNINERDEDENTALHVAIQARKLEHVKLLLEAGASFRMRCDGSWPLHTALSIGAIPQHRQFAYECFVVLHEAGADLSAKDDSLHTPLYLACMFNLPQIVSYILSDEDGLSTVNLRADRAGSRPLHAAAKFDTLANPGISRTAVASATGHVPGISHHHPDGTVISSMHPIPGFSGKQTSTSLSHAAVPTAEPVAAPVVPPSSAALLTQVLLGTTGVELDATNTVGQSPLHVACSRGNWPVVRLLLAAGASAELADRRGLMPGQCAHKRGMPIPNDLLVKLGQPPDTGVVAPPRDLIVDPDGSTLVLSHELCILHRTCPPVRRDDSAEPPPENVRRLHVLVDQETGILRNGEFGNVAWQGEARRAAIGDVLKVHEYGYVENISQLAASIPDHPSAIAHLDPDTAISRWSFESAMRAAGSVCQAVDRVIAGDHRNAFCAVRPPGHHAGPRGIVKCASDPEGGSHGFCLLNNVAIGAAYARSMYRNEGIRKIAIIDFDVHHGNGTEEIIRQLVPTTEKATIRTPFAFGEIASTSYRPWLDETDIDNVFFASTHGYGNRGVDQPGWFYPASGKSQVSEAILHPSMVESPNTADFLLSQTWTRMGEDSKANCCKIINVGLGLPDAGLDAAGRGMQQRLDLRDNYRNKILPHLRDFDPDLIFISAGFDAHRKDTMNYGYVGMVEDDYEWVTEQLVKVANTCCNGRIVSVLEGGYKIHGGIVSPFARSVASHVRGLVDGSRSRELYDMEDAEWESQFERHFIERRERKKEQEREQRRLIEEANRRNLLERMAQEGEVPEDPDAPAGSRKRRRNQVDYKELFKQMQEEGFANG